MARPYETWLHSSGLGPAFGEIIRIKANESRTLLPAPARNYIDWFSNSESVDVIIEMAEAGRIIGMSREQFTARFSEPIEKLIVDVESSDPHYNQVARTALLAIGERFLVAKMSSDRYLPLPPRLTQHLKIELAQEARALFFAIANTFEIWTYDFRDLAHETLSHTFDGTTPRIT